MEAEGAPLFNKRRMTESERGGKGGGGGERQLVENRRKQLGLVIGMDLSKAALDGEVFAAAKLIGLLVP